MGLQVLVLAAGKGTRMKSKYPKVIHEVCGMPMLGHVLRAAEEVITGRPWVVVGFGADQVQQTIGDGPEYILQEQQLGTGHAVLITKERLEASKEENLLVLYGDTPLITGHTLREMVRVHRESTAAATVLTAMIDEPYGYGRILRDADGQVESIVEEKDATPEQRGIREINTGIYCFSINALLNALPRLEPQNAQGEYYLTDVITLLRQDGEMLSTLTLNNSEEVLGPNDRVVLAMVEGIMRRRILEGWMREGVTIVDPSSTYVDARAVIGSDTCLLPGVVIEGTTRIGDDCRIGPSSHLTNAQVGHGTHIFRSVLEDSKVGNMVNVGPYAYLRPGTMVEDHAKIGDFVEIKNSKVGFGSKVPHLSYIGDCTIGKETNIGAGTITCNYDGKHKHPTIIGDAVFVGSNSNLVAPVTIGDGATIGAGSTITKNIPSGALAVERSTQVIKEGWVPPSRR